MIIFVAGWYGSALTGVAPARDRILCVSQSARTRVRLRERSLVDTGQWSDSALRAWQLAHRFQKFLIVGFIGLAVNQGLLVLLHQVFDFSLRIASPVAIFVSMLVTFSLNERWTWHDRGRGPLLHRVLAYFPINLIGLLINFGILTLLVDRWDVHYFLANLIGAGAAAVWNFSLNHRITWRQI